MLTIFYKVLFILMFLVSSFFTVYNAEAKSRAKLSKKYIPPGNPGGVNFYTDNNFSESYKLYEKRREFLKNKKSQDQGVNKEDLIKKLKEKKITSLDSKSRDMEACIVENEEMAMINQYGIDIARLKGAVFIDQDTLYKYESEHYEKEDKKITSTQERKISPINVTIKETNSRRKCSHNSIANLGKVDTFSMNGSSSFGIITDTVK